MIEREDKRERVKKGKLARRLGLDSWRQQNNEGMRVRDWRKKDKDKKKHLKDTF